MLRVAASMFRERGFSSTPAEEVAERLDIGKGSLFYHFGSKHGLLAACHEHSLEALIGEVRAARESGAPSDRALRAAVEGLGARAIDDLDGAAVHTDPRVLPDEARTRIAELWAALEAELEALLRDGASDGTLRGDAPDLAAFVIVSSIAGLAKRHRDGSGGPVDLADILVDGLRTRGLRRTEADRRRRLAADPEEWLRR